jgi:hypothetical protein
LLNGGFGYEDLRLSIPVDIAPPSPIEAISPRRSFIACLLAATIKRLDPAAGQATSHHLPTAKSIPRR